MNATVKYLLDSVILIEHLNNVKKARDWLLSIKDGEAAISVISYSEVLTGLKAEQEDFFNMLIERCYCFDIDMPTAKLAAELRRTYRWKLPDALQAAIAVENQLKFVTVNTKDFSPQKHNFVIIPY